MLFRGLRNWRYQLHILICHIMRHVTIFIISDQMKTKVGLNLKKGVTLLMELTRESVMFNGTREMTRWARLRGLSTKSFHDVAIRPKKYWFDKRTAYSGFRTPSNHDKHLIFPDDCLVLPRSPAYSYNSFASQPQMVCVDLDLSRAVHNTACQ